MYNQDELINILKKSIGEKSLNEFARNSGVDSAYLSRIINKIRTTPPSPKILEKIAQSSHGTTNYEELMQVCGYTENTLETTVYKIYKDLKKLCLKIYKKEDSDYYEINTSLEKFQSYSNDLINLIQKPKNTKILLTKYYNKEFLLEDYNFVFSFLFLYESFLHCMENENYITVFNYTYTNWFDDEDVYNNLLHIKDFEDFELLSINSKHTKFNEAFKNEYLQYIKKFNTCLNLAYLSDFDSNTLTELFKKKAQTKANNNIVVTSKQLTNKNKHTKTANSDEIFSYSEKFFMCPVYGRISAGQPNWVEECIEGRLPIDPVLFDIVNPEEHFFLRVNGESMNKVIKNGAYALIHKQDIVENGEIAVVLVNGYEATLKKFTKQEDVVVLEPLSNDTSFQTQIYNKSTPIKILGKYVGKFEINK